jgi:hypothetical protein
VTEGGTKTKSSSMGDAEHSLCRTEWRLNITSKKKSRGETERSDDEPRRRPEKLDIVSGFRGDEKTI